MINIPKRPLRTFFILFMLLGFGTILILLSIVQFGLKNQNGSENLRILLWIGQAISFFGLIATLFSFGEEGNANRELQNFIRRLRSNERNDALIEGVVQAVKALDQDPSVLRNITNWLYDYQAGVKDIEAAFDIFMQLITRFSSINLLPVGEIGQRVMYDPQKHRNYYTHLLSGSPAVIELGWVLRKENKENLVIRRPLVRGE
jgi:hypothetical protein